MQEEFLVHTREGEPCLRPPEEHRPSPPPEIQRIVVAGRSTYFCPNCQQRLRRRPRRRDGGAAQDEGEVSEPPPLPDGFAVGHWSDHGGRDGLHRGDPAARDPGRGLRARRRAREPARPTRCGRWPNAQEANAVLLTGGSAFGLAAADGVVRWLEEHERGYFTPYGRVPLVPAAVIYDLPSGSGPKARPGPDAGYAACEAAAPGVPERGAVGAGTGATVGKILGRERARPGGIGYAALDHRHRPDGGGARGGQRGRGRDRRGRLGARRAARGGGRGRCAARS